MQCSIKGLIFSVLRFRRFALAVCVIGVLVQLGLTAYYLGMGHKAQPHDVPVGLVSPAAERAEVAGLLTERAGDRPHEDTRCRPILAQAEQARA